jgi:hypothetical protein
MPLDTILRQFIPLQPLKFSLDIVACLLKAGNGRPAWTAVAGERLCKHIHCWVVARRERLLGNATMDEIPGAVFSPRSDFRQTVTLQWNTSHYGLVYIVDTHILELHTKL